MSNSWSGKPFLVLIMFAAFLSWTESSHAVGHLSEDQIQKTLERVSRVMKPIADVLPKGFKIFYKANDLLIGGLVNSWAYPLTEIEIFGNSPEGFSEDGLIAIICHEYGHIAGGGPQVEGQADFFAASACMPRVFAQDDNRQFLRLLQESPELSAHCSNFKIPSQKALCARVILAGQAFTRLLHSEIVSEKQRDPGQIPSYDKSDISKPESLISQFHPIPQCRLDTFVIGAKCMALDDESLTDFSAAQTTCGTIANLVVRPPCWFNADAARYYPKIESLKARQKKRF